MRCGLLFTALLSLFLTLQAPVQAGPCSERLVQAAAVGFVPEANAQPFWQVHGAGFYAYSTAPDGDLKDAYLALPDLRPGETLAGLTLYGYREAGTLIGEVLRVDPEGGKPVASLVIDAGTGYVVRTLTGDTLPALILSDSAYFVRLRVANATQPDQIKALRVVLTIQPACY